MSTERKNFLEKRLKFLLDNSKNFEDNKLYETEVKYILSELKTTISLYTNP